MKKNLICAAVSAMMLLTSCADYYLIEVKLKNDADYPIACLAATESGAGFSYPDTVLPQSLPRLRSFHLNISPDSTCIVFLDFGESAHTDIRDALKDCTQKAVLSLYFFKQSDLDTLNWRDICDQDKCLGRYDFDGRNGDKIVTLHFPPSPDMEGIHMYPPYGTY